MSYFKNHKNWNIYWLDIWNISADQVLKNNKYFSSYLTINIFSWHVLEVRVLFIFIYIFFLLL